MTEHIQHQYGKPQAIENERRTRNLAKSLMAKVLMCDDRHCKIRIEKIPLLTEMSTKSQETEICAHNATSQAKHLKAIAPPVHFF